MFRGNSKKKSGASLVSSSLELNGNITFHDQLIVDGLIVGDIFAEPDSSAMLTVSRTAIIKGHIQAPHVYINGTVEGSIRADKILMLGSKTNITGDIVYNSVQVEKGAQINGNLVHLSRLTEMTPHQDLNKEAAKDPSPSLPKNTTSDDLLKNSQPNRPAGHTVTDNKKISLKN